MKTAMLACSVLLFITVLADAEIFHSDAGRFSVRIPAGWEAVPDDVVAETEPLVAAFQPVNAEAWMDFPHVFVMLHDVLEPQELVAEAAQHRKPFVSRKWHDIMTKAPQLDLLRKKNEVCVDIERKALAMRMLDENPEGGQILSITACFLARDASIWFSADCRPSQWKTAASAFRTILGSVSIDDGYEYQPRPATAAPKTNSFRSFRGIRLIILLSILGALYLARMIARRG